MITKTGIFSKKIKYKKFAIFRILCILFVFFNIEDVQGIIVIQIFYVILPIISFNILKKINYNFYERKFSLKFQQNFDTHC